MAVHQSFPDFILFVYVHLSNVDDNYDPKELATIKDKMKNLFPEDTDLEKKLYQAIREYNAFDKTKLDTFIYDSAKHFKNEKTNQQVFESFHEIVKADGKIDQNEAKALDTLKQIIGV